MRRLYEARSRAKPLDAFHAITTGRKNRILEEVKYYGTTGIKWTTGSRFRQCKQRAGTTSLYRKTRARLTGSLAMPYLRSFKGAEST